jgi:hypothetical protein
MRLYTQGVKLPKLGTIQDRMLRQFLVKESELEAKRVEFQMLTLLTNPTAPDEESARKWRRKVTDIWRGYVSRLFVVDIPSEDQDEEKLKTFYLENVKNREIQLRLDSSTGELVATGATGIL